jgi:hypothetical protein
MGCFNMLQSTMILGIYCKCCFNVAILLQVLQMLSSQVGVDFFFEICCGGWEFVATNRDLLHTHIFCIGVF